MVSLPAVAPASGGVRTRLRGCGDQVGEQVRGISVGDRVYVNPGLSCGSCRACRRGEDPNCPDYTFMGYFAFGPGGQRLFDAYPYGGLAEYLTAPARNLVVLPDSVSFEQGARFGYLGTAFSALRKAGAGPGRTVLVDGISGTLGLGACLIALGLGVTRVMGTGRNAGLLDDVKAIAPDRIDVLPAGAASLPEWVRERTDGEGVDIVIDALGPGAPAEAMLEAIASLGRGGVLVDIGGMMERPALDLFAMMCAQRSVLGSLWFTTAEAQDMADMAGSGALDLSVLEHHTFRSPTSTTRSTPSRSATAASPTSSACRDRHRSAALSCALSARLSPGSALLPLEEGSPDGHTHPSATHLHAVPVRGWLRHRRRRGRSRPGGRHRSPRAGQLRRAGARDDDVPVGGELAAGAHHQPARGGGAARPGDRGRGPQVRHPVGPDGRHPVHHQPGR